MSREERKRRMPSYLATEIRQVVPDVIHPTSEWAWESDSELAGHCYVASEAFYHATGEQHQAQLTPQVVSFDVVDQRGHTHTVSHWYLEADNGQIIDLTEDQFDAVERSIPRDEAVGKGFVPPSPCNDTQRVLHKIEERLSEYVDIQ